MTRWLLYLLLAPMMTPQERADTRAYYRAQRKAFCQRHLIDWDRDDPQTREYLDRKERGEDE